MLRVKENNEKFTLTSHISIISSKNLNFDLSKLSWKNKKVRCLLEISPNFDTSKYDYYKIELINENGEKRKEYVYLNEFSTNYFMEVKPKISYFLRLVVVKEINDENKKKAEFGRFYQFPSYMLQDVQLPEQKLVVKQPKLDIEDKFTKCKLITNEKLENNEDDEDVVEDVEDDETDSDSESDSSSDTDNSELDEDDDEKEDDEEENKEEEKDNSLLELVKKNKKFEDVFKI
jgi:hypothetical protein